MVSFTTGFTRWVDRSRFSVFLVICIVCVGVVGIFNIEVRVSLTTAIVVALAGTFCFVSVLVFLSFGLTALVWVVTWLFAVVTGWLVVKDLGNFEILLMLLLKLAELLFVAYC